MSENTNTSAIEPINPTKTLREVLYAPTMLEEFRKVLPPGLTPEAIVRQALTLVSKNPTLNDCDQKTILAGIMDAAQLGLELTGPLGHAFLIPRHNSKTGRLEATFQVGWKGLVRLAQQSGRVCEITARVVYEHDPFDYQMGTDQWIKHRAAAGDRGRPTHYYATAAYQNCHTDFEVMTVAEVQAHRLRYSPPGKRKTAWDTDFDPMAKKTVVAALCRRLSLAPRAQYATAVDECRALGIDPYAPRERVAERAQRQPLLDRLAEAEAAVAAEAAEEKGAKP